MASSILVRAKNTIERAKVRAKRAAVENEHVIALAVGGVTGSGVAVGAAFADQKMGAGKQWKVGPVPVVGLIGAGALVPSFFLNKYPIAQLASFVAGTTAINIAAYRYLIEENVIEPGEASST